MKLWKIVSLIDRDRTLSDSMINLKWKWFQDHLNNFGEIVERQRREILDFDISGELIPALLAHSTFRFNYNKGYLRCRSFLETEESMSALEALENFGEEAVFQAFDGGLHECDRLR